MKRFLVILVVLLATLSVVTQASAAVGADDVRLLGMTNEERAAEDALLINAKVSNYAYKHSIAMAERGSYFHTKTNKFRKVLSRAGVSWKHGGENVGTASDGWDDPLQTIQNAFLKSPGHLANIVNPNYTNAGIGVYIAPDGSTWVTVVFYG